MIRVGLARKTAINRMTVPNPSFSLPFADLGAGQVSLVEAVSAALATFVRATPAWTRLSTGLWASVSSGVARSYYDINGVYGGYLPEVTVTADGTFPRDLTNAAWNTKTNVTAAKDQTGIDGVANSASSVVATAGNGVITQAVTLTSRVLTFQCFVKRITGTGTILISLDGFATNTDITSLISSSAWTDVGAIFKTQTLANPAFGFKIVTSGDKIAVDMADLVEGSYVGTPLNGTTRNGDGLTFPFITGLNLAGSCYAELRTLWSAATGATQVAVSLQAGGTGLLRDGGGQAPTAISANDGTNNLVKTALTDMSTATRKRISTWGANGLRITGDGAAFSSTSFDGDMGSVSIGVGCDTSGATQWNGPIKTVRLYPTQLPDSVGQQLTT